VAMTIGSLSRRTGVPVNTLRTDEDKGLIYTVGRSRGTTGCSARRLNFWWCRHAHCVVTSMGWLALSVLAFTQAGLGRSPIGGDEQLVFLAVLAAGAGFEAVWCCARGTRAVARGTTAGRV
jgi:hypothetical protein